MSKVEKNGAINFRLPAIGHVGGLMAANQCSKHSFLFISLLTSADVVGTFNQCHDDTISPFSHP